jgi:hypothetical protein
MSGRYVVGVSQASCTDGNDEVDAAYVDKIFQASISIEVVNQLTEM